MIINVNVLFLSFSKGLNFRLSYAETTEIIIHLLGSSRESWIQIHPKKSHYLPWKQQVWGLMACHNEGSASDIGTNITVWQRVIYTTLLKNGVGSMMIHKIINYKSITGDRELDSSPGPFVPKMWDPFTGPLELEKTKKRRSLRPLLLSQPFFANLSTL